MYSRVHTNTILTPYIPADGANNTQMFCRIVNTIMLVVVFVLLLGQINAEVCKYKTVKSE